MKLNQSIVARTAVILWAVLLSACASTQSNISNGAGFASAGIAYVDATPAILDESFALTVATNSHQLIMARDPLTEEEREDALERMDDLLKQRLALHRDLKTHSLLLRSYFLSLKALTASDSASGIDAAAQDVVTRMNTLHPSIAQAGGGKIQALISPAVNMAVGTFQNAALNKELKAHGDAIERELDLQKAAIEIIVEQMQDDAQLIIQIEQLNPIADEFVTASKVSDNWSDKRISAFKQTVKLQSLDDINKAASNLHSSWITFVEKRDSAGTLGLLVQDIEQMLSIARQFQSND